MHRFKGVLLPLVKSGDCTLREALVFGSVLAKATPSNGPGVISSGASTAGASILTASCAIGARMVKGVAVASIFLGFDVEEIQL